MRKRRNETAGPPDPMGPPGDEEPLAGELAEIEREEPDGPDEPDGGLPAGDSALSYLKEIGRIPLLDPEEEIRLARRISAGKLARELLDGQHDDPDPESLEALEKLARAGERAKEQMAEANLRLVISIARRYVNRGLPFQDLVQEGNLGLLKAVDRFDHEKGFKFSTYATWWIRQGITRAIADQGRTIRVPVHMVEAIGRINQAARQLEQELGRDPSPEEIAEALEWPVDKIRDAMRTFQATASLDAPAGEDGDASLGDFVPDESAGGPDEELDLAMLRERLAEVLGTLRPREAEVLRLRFGTGDGRPRSLEEIGGELGITRERVRQIEVRALRKLRHPTRSRKLKDFYE